MEFFQRSAEGVVAGATLLAASVSVGNVGQLACEVLLTNYDHELVGYLLDPCVLPCFGHDPFKREAEPSSAVSLELYRLKTAPQPVYLLQQRAPAHLGCQRLFAANLAQWLQQSGFQRVLILSSIEAEARRDAQLMNKGCWYVRTGQQLSNDLDQQGLESLFPGADKELLSRSLPPWPLLAECEKREIDATAILAFTVEGDNLPDGLEQAKIIQSCLELESKPHMQLPASVMSLFGTREPA